MTAMNDNRRADSVWRNSDFLRLWLGGTISIFGSLVTRTALPFAAILALGAGPIEIATLRALQLLPGLLLGLFAGAWVDRLRRRPIMIVADVARAGLILMMPFAASRSVGLVYLVAAAIGRAGRRTRRPRTGRRPRRRGTPRNAGALRGSRRSPPGPVR